MKKYTVAIDANNNTFWYKEGTCILHRENGPAIEYSNGSKFWYKEGNLHRLDGPACEYPDGSKVWFKEGKRHRENGPAVEYANGTKEYWVEGKFFTEIEFNKEIRKRNSPSCDGKIVEIEGKKYKLIEIEKQ